MSKIANVRLFEHKAFGGNPRNPYWQGYLPDKDIPFLQGFDAANKEVDDAIDDLYVIMDDLTELGLDPSRLDLDVIASNKLITDYQPEELKEMTPETKCMTLLYQFISRRIEVGRNEFVTAAIDATPETEYKKIVSSVLSGDRINAYTNR